MVRGKSENRSRDTGLREIYTVSRLNEAARAALESRLGHLWVEGEVSNLARPASGHLYFTLKDATAQALRHLYEATRRALLDSAIKFDAEMLSTIRADYIEISRAMNAGAHQA